MSRITVSEQDVRPVQRQQIKAAIGIDGTSGSGKSGAALLIANALEKDWTKIHATDAENLSLALYADKTLNNGVKVGKFYHAKLSKQSGYSPFNYEFYRRDAIKKKCAVAIMDSSTHMWQREGGVLDMVNKIQAEAKYNRFSAWGHPDVNDGKHLIFDLVRDDTLHVISTMRIKEAYIMKVGNDGSTKVESVGEKQMQQDGLQYEFDLLIRMQTPGDTETKRAPVVTVLKSRYDIFKVGETYELSDSILKALKSYLEEGTSKEEIEHKLRDELIKGLRERANTKKSLKTIFVNKHPQKKLDDLTLEELRALNSDFLQVEYQ